MKKKNSSLESHAITPNLIYDELQNKKADMNNKIDTNQNDIKYDSDNFEANEYSDEEFQYNDDTENNQEMDMIGTDSSKTNKNEENEYYSDEDFED